ncbi:hypothetical protein EDS67_07335 [candidate division KSB1 bacterium]|nr:MAG: hypothetical protein EDS67_07335 [candidate division KSB1 bacterium]MBC6947301.1 hypothetical protein [candidate division KSB1 bacterium]MCE7941402.1 hypothetical protein [Chlorobi bacterium CHB1]
MELRLPLDFKEFLSLLNAKKVELTETAFHGSTHKLIFPNSYGFGAENTLHVIVLKDLIEEFKKAA